MLHVIAGMIILVFGVFGVISWWEEFGLVLRGIIPIIFVIGGLVAIGSGLTNANEIDAEDDAPEEE